MRRRTLGEPAVPNYKPTISACFIGYITQVIVNNFLPLLFFMLQTDYSIALSQLTLLISVNFAIQLIVDLLATKLVDKIGMRPCVLFAHVCCALGLVGLAFLPDLLPSAFAGFLICVCVYATGGGLIEVVISPVVEATPSKNKEKTMSLLHSFYCWRHLGVVLLSTLFFTAFGISNWRILAGVWAVVPAVNLVLFSFAPIASLIPEGERGYTLKELLGQKLFWMFFLMMICAGASEQAVSQWASAFAEQGLQVSKTIGDLAGPMAFAFLMGVSRLIYGKWGDKINLDRFMIFSCILCAACYLVTALVPNPVAGLIGCALCGFSVGIMWPGLYSKASASLKLGGNAMFALLALGGDLGCWSGPALAGLVADAAGGDLHYGILAAVAFPVLLLICFPLCRLAAKPKDITRKPL